MGRMHAKSILQHPRTATLTGCDTDPSRAQELSKEIGAEWLPLDEALESGAYDAFFVASPPSAHLDQVTRAARGGAYVFCEKPLGEDLASIDAAMPNLRQHGDRIQVGFNRRFDPHMAELKKRLLAGKIGQIEQLRIVSRDHTAPCVDALQNSSGLIAETAIHDFDLTRWLLDDEVAEVMCMGSALINPAYASVGHIDTATTLLRGSRGQQVVIQNSWRTSYGYDQRVEAFGAGGRLSVANPAGPLVAQEDASGLHRDLIAPDWLARYPEAYFIQATAFLDAASRRDAVSPDLKDGYAASYIAQKAADSLKSGLPEACEYGGLSVDLTTARAHIRK